MSAPVDHDDRLIANSIRSNRLARGLTLAQVAALSGVSSAHLSRLENGERTPTVRVMLQLSRAYGVTLSRLLGESDEDVTNAHISRAADRTRTTLDRADLATLTRSTSRSFQAFELDMEPGRAGDLTAHEGDELIYVLDGDVDVTIGATTITLASGDAAHFDSATPHFLSNTSARSARAILVTSTRPGGPITAH